MLRWSNGQAVGTGVVASRSRFEITRARQWCLETAYCPKQIALAERSYTLPYAGVTINSTDASPSLASVLIHRGPQTGRETSDTT